MCLHEYLVSKWSCLKELSVPATNPSIKCSACTQRWKYCSSGCAFCFFNSWKTKWKIDFPGWWVELTKVKVIVLDCNNMRLWFCIILKD